MLEGARIIAERRISVLNFPEGGRSAAGLREFKEGPAYIAIKAGVPLVPVAIVGMRELLPMGDIHLRSGNVVLPTKSAAGDTGREARLRCVTEPDGKRRLYLFTFGWSAWRTLLN